MTLGLRQQPTILQRAMLCLIIFPLAVFSFTLSSLLGFIANATCGDLSTLGRKKKQIIAQKKNKCDATLQYMHSPPNIWCGVRPELTHSCPPFSRAHLAAHLLRPVCLALH